MIYDGAFPATLVYDTKLHRPACVLLQVALGGTAALAREFPAEDWLVASTPDMHRFTISDAEELATAVRVSARLAVRKP